MNAQQPRVVLRLNAGESSLTKQELVWGTAVAPFSVGTLADWPVRASGVGEVHLFLAFDGFRLHAAAASPSHAVSANGMPIGQQWTPLDVPASLVFGSAHVGVECEDAARPAAAPIRPRPIVDLSRADRQPTQVVDMSRTLQLRTVRLEIPESMLAELRGATAAGSAPASTPEVTPKASLSRDTASFQAAPVETLIFPLPASVLAQAPAVDLTNTLYDGGALRERAVQLASALVERPEATSASAQGVSVSAPELRPSALAYSVAAFRQSSLPKQLALALLPLAIAGVWAMRDGSASASSAPPPVAAAKPAALVASSAPPAPPMPVLAHAVVSAAAVPASSTDPGERQALIAAFSGNKAEAAALYERLATARNSRMFALAARLAREDRMRTP